MCKGSRQLGSGAVWFPQITLALPACSLFGNGYHIATDVEALFGASSIAWDDLLNFLHPNMDHDCVRGEARVDGQRTASDDHAVDLALILEHFPKQFSGSPREVNTLR